MMEVKVGWWIALNAISFFPQKYFFCLFDIFLFIHRSCITQGNIVLKVVNSRCLEKVKTAEQQQQQQQQLKQ